MFSKKGTEIVSKKENWINSELLTLSKLKGKIVLLDFWTYSCINCLRTLPALREMWAKYRDKGLVIIGIHTPEFDFEKELKNVKNAVKSLEIKYPVLSDPERINWDNYGNSYWPRSALIDSGGDIIMDHVGEAGYDEIEEKIIGELTKLGRIKERKLMKEKRRYYQLGMSPETYVGSSRNTFVGSSKVCTKDGCDEYHDPGKHLRDVVYLSGMWEQKPEYAEFIGKEGYILYRFYASEANLVMNGNGISEVLLNNKPLTKSNAGKDIIFKKGKSYVKIDRPDMYNLIKMNSFNEGELKVISFKGLKTYAYTFG